MALLIAGCSIAPPGAAVLIIANRSDVALALYPTVIVEPCSFLVLDQAAVEAGKDAFEAAESRGEDWVPEGALRFGQEIPPRRNDATAPMTVVVSSQPLVAIEAVVPESELPPCGGAPAGVVG